MRLFQFSLFAALLGLALAALIDRSPRAVPAPEDLLLEGTTLLSLGREAAAPDNWVPIRSPSPRVADKASLGDPSISRLVRASELPLETARKERRSTR